MKPDLDSELESLRIERTPQPDPKGRPGVQWILLAAMAAIGVAAPITAYELHDSAPPVEVTRAIAAQSSSGEDAPVALSATGYIVAHHEIQVASKVSGKVAWIGVDEGSAIKKGEVLVRLEDTEYRAQVEQAQGNLANLESKLLELEDGSRPQEVIQAYANLLQGQADLTNSKLAFERSSALFADGIVSRQDYDNSRYNYQDLEAKANSLKQAYELVEKGPRQEEIEAMEGEVEQAEGLLAYDKDQENNTTIRSPIDGRVLERAVEVGEYVTNGFVGDKGAKGYVVTLADLNDLQVELDISENDFSKIRMGSKAVVTTDAYPDRKYDGELVEISPVANRQKATVQVKVQILHPDSHLRPDMNATVAFVDRTHSHREQSSNPVLTVPAAAVKDQSVFVVSRGRAVQRHVRILASTPMGVQISQGLLGGEDVILNPPANLRTGEKVRVEGDRHE
jgi:HlyD family secretion protein